MKLLFPILLIIKLHFSFAQNNLVPNSSFENYSTCPNAQGEIYLVPPWYSPTPGTLDYYNVCSTNSNFSVPQNVGGYELPFEGNAYVGLYTFNYSFASGEYIQTKLLDSLTKNKKYCIEFYISLQDNSQYTTCNIGLFISNTAINSNSNGQLPYVPQIKNTSILQVTNKNGWNKISSYYIAQGGEMYITIGNFNPNSFADTVFVDGGTWPVSYYFIDSIYVGLTDTIFSISGTLSYDNTQNTPLGNIKLFLNQNGISVDSTITDTLGAYIFNSVTNGTYTITATTTKVWSNITATDALLVERHIVGLSLLVEPRLSAADVNYSGFLSSIDALRIKRRVAGLINNFPSGDWYFNPQPVTVSNADVIMNFKGICYGDVNGSYIPY